MVCVAAIVVPEVVVVQVEPELTATEKAPAQSLLAGCAYEIRQIENKNVTNKKRFMILTKD
jgi:hypothetical protein